VADNQKVRVGLLTPMAEVLPATVPTSPPALSPEAESPHRKLARLNSELERVTEQIRAHSKAWGERNLRSQSVREPVTTPASCSSDRRSRMFRVNVPYGFKCCHFRGDSARRSAAVGGLGTLVPPTLRPASQSPLVLGKTRPWIESCAIALTDVKNKTFPSGASMLDKIWLLRGGPVLWIALQ
jgi:hypothetical protein